MIKTIIFDFDGVIVESIDIKADAFAKLFAKEGKEIVNRVVDYHLNNGGKSRYEKFRYIYREILKRKLSKNEFKGLCNRFADFVAEGVISAPYVKGAREFLEDYSSKYKCFVVSATPQRELEDIIKRRYINRFFKVVYGAPKNKTNAVKDILVRERIKPICALYIGDALSDYEAAKDNGVNFIARINSNKSIPDGIGCLKIRDLINLGRIVETYPVYTIT